MISKSAASRCRCAMAPSSQLLRSDVVSDQYGPDQGRSRGLYASERCASRRSRRSVTPAVSWNRHRPSPCLEPARRQDIALSPDRTTRLEGCGPNDRSLPVWTTAWSGIGATAASLAEAGLLDIQVAEHAAEHLRADALLVAQA